MPRKNYNTQLFALRHLPPKQIEIRGRQYHLVRAFKHDFFAATCLYESIPAAGNPAAVDAGAEMPKIVVKFGRSQPFCGLPLRWYGCWLRAHEEAIYRLLAGVQGVPRWVGRVGQTGYAIEYVEAKPLDHIAKPPAGFFDRLRQLFDQLHERGVAFCDANKRSNILVADDGRPFLVDYQIAVRRLDDWPWPLRAISRAVVNYLATKDIYHLYKHKSRLSPEELQPAEEVLCRRPVGLHWLHRSIVTPYRTIRRKFLRKQYAKGALHSPTADLESHYQPEKETWRKTPMRPE